MVFHGEAEQHGVSLILVTGTLVPFYHVSPAITSPLDGWLGFTRSSVSSCLIDVWWFQTSLQIAPETTGCWCEAVWTFGRVLAAYSGKWPRENSVSCWTTGPRCPRVHWPSLPA